MTMKVEDVTSITSAGTLMLLNELAEKADNLRGEKTQQKRRHEDGNIDSCLPISYFSMTYPVVGHRNQ